MRKTSIGRRRRGRTNHRIELLEPRRLLSSITGISDPFSVTDQLVFTSSPPANVKAGSVFSATVQAQDAAGNVDPSFNGTITLSDRYDIDYGSTIDGTLSVKAVNGVATFTDLSQDMSTAETDWAEGDILYADSGKLPEGASPAFNLFVDKLAFLTQPPAAITAGSPFGVQVEALDTSGALDTSFQGKVTLSDRYWFDGYGLQGGLTVRAVNGIATFSGITQPTATTSELGKDGIYAYGFWEGIPNAYSNPLLIAPAAPSQLVFTTAPADADGNILPNEPLGVQVAAEDAYGNVETSFDGDISLSLGAGAAGATLGGKTTVTADHGIANFDDITLNAAGSGYKLLASGLKTAESQPFDVTDRLVFTTQPPAGVVAGAPFTVVVAAEDGAGQVDPSFNGSVNLSDSYNDFFNSPLDGKLTVNAVNGIATFSGLSQSTPSSQGGDNILDMLNAEADGAFSAKSDSFAVIDAGGDTLVFTTQPATTIPVNSPFNVVVEVHHPSGQLDTSFEGIVTLDDRYTRLFSADLQGPYSAQAVDGVATITGLSLGMTTAQAGNGTLDQLDANADGAQPATSDEFSVVAADEWFFTKQPPESINAGAPFTVTVSAKDASGNVDTSYNGPVTLSDQYAGEYHAPLSGTLTVNAVDGIATFSGISQNLPLALTRKFDNDVLVVSGGGYAPGTSVGIDLMIADGSQVLEFLTQPPATIAAGSTFSVSVAAEDSSGHVLTSFNGSVELDVSDWSNGPTTVDAVNGVATFTDLSFVSVSLDGSVYLQAFVNGEEADSNNFDVTAGPATQLEFQTTARNVNGEGGAAMLNGPLTVSVQAEDAFGNFASSFEGDVTLSLGSAPAGAKLGGTVTVAAVDGIATFDNFTLDTRGASYTLIANGPGTATSDSFTVGDQLVFTTQPPAVMRIGQSFSVVVTAEDGRGSIDPTFDGDVTLSEQYDYGLLNGTTTVKAVGGVANFSGLSYDAATDAMLLADSDGQAEGASSLYSVETDQLTFATQPASATSGQVFNAVVEVDYPTGGVDTSFNGNVTLSDAYANDYNTPTSLKGTLTVQAVNGVANFSGIWQGLASNTAGYPDTLYANADGLFQSSSNQFPIAAGAATKLAFVAPPTDTNGDGAAVAKARLSVQVTAVDDFGNADSNFNGTVTLALNSNPTNATLGGATTMALTHGAANFTDLTISSAGDAYTLLATADGSDTSVIASIARRSSTILP